MYINEEVPVLVYQILYKLSKMFFFVDLNTKNLTIKIKIHTKKKSIKKQTKKRQEEPLNNLATNFRSEAILKLIK